MYLDFIISSLCPLLLSIFSLLSLPLYLLALSTSLINIPTLSIPTLAFLYFSFPFFYVPPNCSFFLCNPKLFIIFFSIFISSNTMYVGMFLTNPRIHCIYFSWICSALVFFFQLHTSLRCKKHHFAFIISFKFIFFYTPHDELQ